LECRPPKGLEKFWNAHPLTDFRRYSDGAQVERDSGAQHNVIVIAVVKLRDILHRQVAERDAPFDIGLDWPAEKSAF
jgi:hypothetical protein